MVVALLIKFAERVAGDGANPAAVADVRPNIRMEGEWLQIPFDELTAGGMRDGIGCLPAGCFQ